MEVEAKYGECSKHPGNSMLNCFQCQMENPINTLRLKTENLIIGDGLLGSEIVKQTSWDCVSRKRGTIDISDPSSWNFNNYKVIINCIANTNTYSNDKKSHWDINYKFVYDLIQYCNLHKIKLIHISTEYLYTHSINNATEEDVPVHCRNWYGYTKLLGDGIVQLLSDDYLICRCMHKPTPFIHKEAWIDQVGNFDYVDIISSLIIKSINKDLKGVYNIGTDTKTMYDLALKTNSNVVPSMAPIQVPNNISMSVEKLNIDTTDIPFFSIAIPTYEYGGRGIEFLTYSFSKISEQTFKNFEVVVSDHSQNDEIENLCIEWSKKFRLKYVRNEHGRGIISPNINVAMKHCSGEYIKILFQDDFLYGSTSLSQTHDFIKNEVDVEWLATSFYHSIDGVNMYRPLVPEWNDHIWTGRNTMGCPSGICIKNKNILYFDEDLNWMMDVDFYKRMFNRHGQPKILIDFTVVNRTWGERLTDTINEEIRLNEIRKMMDRYA